MSDNLERIIEEAREAGESGLILVFHPSGRVGIFSPMSPQDTVMRLQELMQDIINNHAPGSWSVQEPEPVADSDVNIVGEDAPVG